MNFRDRAVIFLATGFGAGRIPLAPGTAGALVGLAACYALSIQGAWAASLGAGAFALFAVWVAGRAEALLGQRDAPAIVIDEIAGMLVTLAGMPFTAVNAVLGFAAFRALDIIKPYPARLFDTKVKGGWGVVLDDVVAGLYSHLLLRLVQFISGA